MPTRRRNSFGGFDIVTREFKSSGPTIRPTSVRDERCSTACASADSGSPAPYNEPQSQQPSTLQAVQGSSSGGVSSEQESLGTLPILRRRSVQLPIEISEYTVTHPDFCRDDKVTVIPGATWERSARLGFAPHNESLKTLEKSWIGRIAMPFKIPVRLLQLSSSLCREKRGFVRWFRQNHPGEGILGGCSICYKRDEPLLALCESCREMVLGHHFLCRKFRFSMPVRLKTAIAESTTRPECRICHMITHVATKLFPNPQDLRTAQKLSAYMEIVPWFDSYPWTDRRFVESIRLSYISREEGVRIMEVPYSTMHFRQGNYLLLDPGQINWYIIRKTLNHCLGNHAECRRRPSRPLPSEFLLINVWNRQLVPGNGQSSFVALSYVWGDKPDASKIQSERLNINDLKRPGGLQLDTLPATIRDAMKCCLFLGQQYLWADRLCIVQDDPWTKGAQIHAMDAIFSSALVVLIDGSGTDMNSGISGISRKRSGLLMREAFDIPRLGILSECLPTLSESLSASKWLSRGWTYQEGILARRKLYFTADQVFFVCNKGIAAEDGGMGSHYNTISGAEQALHIHGGPFQSYMLHLELFTQRSLGYQSDICNAFTGIANALYSGPDSTLYAIPRFDLDLALLWIPVAAPPEIRKSTTPPFPSWAWSSILGEITYIERDTTAVYKQRQSHFSGTLVKWFELRRCVGGHLLKAIKVFDDAEYFRESAAKYMHLAWTLGCIERPLPWKNGFFGREIEPRWSDYRDFYVEAFGGAPSITTETTSGTATIRCAMSIKHAESSLLFGRAQTARFNICYKMPDHCQLHSVCPNDESTFGYIMDSQGNRVGVLHSGEHKAKALQLRLSSRSCTRRFTFIALSISNLSISKISGSRLERLERCTCGSCQFGKQFGRLSTTNRYFVDNPVVNVMMIGKSGAYSYRLNLGYILLAAWAEADRKFEDIFLE